MDWHQLTLDAERYLRDHAVTDARIHEELVAEAEWLATKAHAAETMTGDEKNT